MRIRFLHWNIFFKEKIENILSFISYVSPDVICLNELSKGMEYNDKIDTSEYLGNRLQMDYFSKSYMDWKGDGSLQVINGIYSYFPMVKKRFVYTKKIDLNNEQKVRKGSVYLEAEIRINEHALTFATDHLNYISRYKEPKDKIKEVDELAKIIRSKKSGFIFSGDLNAPPKSYAIRQISKYLTSCGPDHSKKTAFTKKVADYAGWETGFEWRLDYVFATKDVKVRSARILKTYNSDHLPILVEFEI